MEVDIGLPTVRQRVIFREANFSFPIRSECRRQRDFDDAKWILNIALDYA
jgi:hypothetical protein